MSEDAVEYGWRCEDCGLLFVHHHDPCPSCLRSRVVARTSLLDGLPVLVPPLGLAELERIGRLGRSRGHDDGPVPRWQTRDVDRHLEHARRHLEKLDQGDTSEDHLAHAAWRLVAALHQRVAGTTPKPRQEPA